jgi:pilus assembly protein CpaE
MDPNHLFVLLIQKESADGGAARHALSSDREDGWKLQCVDSLPTALARLGGGGVDLIVLDLALRGEPASEGLVGFLQLRQAAPLATIVVLYDPSDEGLALRAMRAGAADTILKEHAGERIALVLHSAHSAAERAREPLDARSVRAPAPQRTGAALAFMGAKGGVGSTTVALNVASALAKRNPVILVEMQPAFGTLQPYFKPHGLMHNISHLLREEAANAATCLWPSKSVPGLSVLFGPQLAAECGDYPPDRVKKLIHTLSGLADYVVLDLPCSLADANRAAVESSNRLILVMERDPVCIQSARLMAQAIEAWEGTPQPIEMIVVNRSLLSCPIPLAEVEAQLGFPPLAVVPPGPDICLAAQRAHLPVIAFQPDSLVSDSLIGLAAKCESFARTVPMVA